MQNRDFDLIADSGYRYERKYVVSNLGTAQLHTIIHLHPAAFVQVNPPRQINNIYLDSMNLENYRNHVDGLERRAKVRVRWYGNFEGKIEDPTLEIKVKSGYVGYKCRYPILPFEFSRSFIHNNLRKTILSSAIPEHVRDIILTGQFTIVNTYLRHYYCGRSDKDMRLTLDSDMHFYRPEANRRGLFGAVHDSTLKVIELKYSVPRAVRGHRMLQGFPFRVTRFSKYCYGLERLWKYAL